MNYTALEQMTSQYLESLTWAEQIDIERPDAELSDALKTLARNECWLFLNLIDMLNLDVELRESGYTYSDLGHNFYLSRQGHGARFLDRDDTTLSKKLYKLSIQFRPLNIYFDNENFIHAH